MRIRVGVATDIGRVRDHNEDGYLAEAPVFAVADGMGGHRGGEVASRVALEAIEEARRGGSVALSEAVREANRAVLDRAGREEGLSGMGTTMTALLAKRDGIELAHVGDSRAYLLRDGELQQLTEDHTLVHRMVLEGKLTEAEARIHPHRSILTRALGIEANVEVDGATLDVRQGDRVLLCSDGLTSMVGDDVIGGILSSTQDPQDASERLVEAANEAGGQDNITAVVLDWGDGEGVELPAGGAGPERPAPEPEASPRRSRRRVRRAVIWGLLILLAASAGLVATRMYLDRQWFVGVSDGRVALYRGIPAEVLGLDLSKLVEETQIAAADAEALGPWAGLEEGITASSEAEAREIIAQIAADVRERAAEEEPPEEEPADGGGAPGGGGGGGGGDGGAGSG